MLKTEIGRMRLIGILEGISYLLLLGIAMPLKYMMGTPIAVRIAGSVHGFLFIAFCIILLNTKIAMKWSLGRAAKVFIASIIPFGTFVIDKSLQKEEKKHATTEEN